MKDSRLSDLPRVETPSAPRTSDPSATDPLMIQTLFGSTEEKPSFLQRMKEAVTRTRETLSERIEIGRAHV